MTRPPSSQLVAPALELRLRPHAPATAAGAAVRAAAEATGLGATRATRLGVLCEQLVTEARDREAVAGDTDVVVRLVEHAGVLAVEVADQRLPLAPAEARRAPSRRLVALGFADHLHLGAHGVDGNVAEVAVTVSDPSGIEVDGEEVLPDDVDRATDAEADALELRELLPTDAAGLARCVYRCYGYSYVDPLLYRPEHVRRAVRAGLLRSVVAVTPAGEVVGHIAMTFDRPGDRVPEGGKLVVDPRYRGHHLADRLAAARRDLAERLGVPGIWVECVTNHTFSQHEVLASGGSETGLLIGVTPATVSMTGLGSAAEGRHTLLAMYLPVGAATSGDGAPLCVPDRHAAFVAGLVERSGLRRRLAPSAPPAAGTTTTASASVDAAAGIATVRLGEVGVDVVERVEAELESLDAFDLAVVLVDVPVHLPAGAWAVEALERLRCSVAAWLPGFGADGDVLRLQQVGSHPVDTAHVEVARPEAEAVRDHVIAEWHRVRTGG